MMLPYNGGIFIWVLAYDDYGFFSWCSSQDWLEGIHEF